MMTAADEERPPMGKKAAELLAENNYRINEVAYLVGFSSPSYFTLSFQKQFNMLPSEFTKKKTQ